LTARRVAILSGGRSSEHEVSVASARSVADALTGLGMDVITVEIGRDGAWTVGSGPPSAPPELGTAPDPASDNLSLAPVGAAERLPAPSVTAALAQVDVVFPVLHGPFGEDGTVQGLLELADVAYVGGGFTPEVGLHNVIEPLVSGAPVLMGPNRGKARRLAEEVLRAGAGLEVGDGATLVGALRSLLRDPERRKAVAAAGRDLLAAHRGAAERQARSLVELIA